MKGHLRRRDGAALDVLLAELDELAADGNVHAEADARAIRKGGKPAAERLVAESARIVAECRMWATRTLVTAAALRYERATTGRDLAALPSEHFRARAVATAQAQRTFDPERRVREVLARAQERADARLLTAMRSGALIGAHLGETYPTPAPHAAQPVAAARFVPREVAPTPTRRVGRDER